MSEDSPRVRIVRAPEMHTDVLILRRDTEAWTLIGRQIEGRGRVVPTHEPYQLANQHRIEIYSSATDIGRARLKRLDAPLREFLDIGVEANPHLDVEDVDEIPLDVDGYV